MKHLPKHLRPRYRYLFVAIETWPQAEIDRSAFQRALRDVTRRLHGAIGVAEIDPNAVRFELGEGSGRAIVRVRRNAVGRARAALACLERIDDEPVGLRVLGVSGTIRAGEEKYMGGDRERIGEKTVAFENERFPGYVRADRVDVRIDGTFAGATDLDLQG